MTWQAGTFTDAASDRGVEILEKRWRLQKAREDVRHAEYELAKARLWLTLLENEGSTNEQ